MPDLLGHAIAISCSVDGNAGYRFNWCAEGQVEISWKVLNVEAFE